MEMKKNFNEKKTVVGTIKDVLLFLLNIVTVSQLSVLDTYVQHFFYHFATPRTVLVSISQNSKGHENTNKEFTR